MFDPARRFRLLAAVGLVLTLAQGQAWSQEPIWTTAEDLLRLIRELPCIIGQTTATEQPQRQSLFAWDTPDEIGWHRGMAEFYEQFGEPHAAYQHYKCLSRRCPGQQEFVDAAERQRARLWQERLSQNSWLVVGPSFIAWINDADSPLLNPREDGAGNAGDIAPMASLPCETTGDARMEDCPLPLPREQEKSGSVLSAIGVHSDAELTGVAVPVTPSTRILLPDCERIRLLQEWGLIPAPTASPPVKRCPRWSEGFMPGYGIIF